MQFLLISLLPPSFVLLVEGDVMERCACTVGKPRFSGLSTGLGRLHSAFCEPGTCALCHARGYFLYLLL